LEAVEVLWSVAGAPHLEWLRGRGLKDVTIREAYLGYTPGAITIPYLNPPLRSDGVVSVRQIRKRNLHGLPKYETPKGGKSHIYNVAVTDRPVVYLTEGEFDALILRQLGKAAVGVPGVSVFQSEWKYLFTHCEHVYLVFDADDAGKGGGNRIAGILGQYVEKLSIIHLPPGKDVTDLYLEDPEHLRRLIG
jgi:hypothetical protein